MPAILSSLPNQSVFEPEATRAMSTAFDDVCRAMNIPAHETVDREAIAMRIIDLARAGEIDPVAIRDRVLREQRSRTP
jgi:hypothetical protein